MFVVLYADDILLISGSRLRLKKLLDICDSYAKDHFLVFNGNNSWCMMYGKYPNYICLKEMSIASVNICWVDGGVYLGMKLIA